jgi:hypothetical protein
MCYIDLLTQAQHNLFHADFVRKMSDKVYMSKENEDRIMQNDRRLEGIMKIYDLILSSLVDTGDANILRSI